MPAELGSPPRRGTLESIVVATDLSPSAGCAVVWAAAMADRAGATLTPAIAYGEPSPETPAQEMLAHRESVLRQVDRELAWLGLAHRHRDAAAAFGDAHVIIPRLAQHHDADLLVVGTRGAGGFAGLRLGSVSNHLLHHTVVPLAVVPPTAPVSTTGPLLVGVDGSEQSAAAFDWALHAATSIGAPLHAIYVHDPLIGPARYTWLEPSAPGREERAARRLVVDRAAGAQPVELTRIDAPTVDGLAMAASDRRALAIVVGAKRTDRLGGRLLSRVPSQLVHHCDHPVIVIRE